MSNTQFTQRKNTRLRDYDYSSPGAYMVTICTKERRERPFGVLRDGAVVLSELGELVAQRWTGPPEHHPGVSLDQWIVMPDHVHGILLFMLKDKGEASLAPTTSSTGVGLPRLGTVIGAFKSGVSRVAGRKGNGQAGIWQRGYYEHVLRNQQDLESAREYIMLNPLRAHEESSRCS
jgi:REP element-mobilizing transposase RayT